MRLIPSAVVLALALATQGRAADDYQPGPDSKPQPGVPQGQVLRYKFDHSKIFPGTTRDYWVYVPQQYEASRPACLMVFQDGIQYRAPDVFNNLIFKKEMPVTIGVFVTPGVVKSLSTNALDRFNRSYEYDGLGDNYVRFLTEELLPEVTAKYNISADPNDHAIAGASSGAIAAFSAAWERPDAFRRVFSSIGTYVGLRGGNIYPTLIRKTEPKALRVFLQDGANDLNIYGGNWHLANEEMLSALQFAGYEVNYIWGDGAHNGKHATAIFPDALRWLWKDYPATITAGRDSRQPLTNLLISGEGWQDAGAGHQAAGSLAANATGEVFFAAESRIYKIGLDGKASVFAENCPETRGLGFGPDGKLYACQTANKRLVSYDSSGTETTVAAEAAFHDLAVSHSGSIYAADPSDKKVWLISPDGKKTAIDDGIDAPSGIQLTPDQSLLLVADRTGQFIYSFQIQPDGAPAFKQRYFYLHLVDGEMGSGADGMAADSAGNLYVATSMGIQVCDQAGRVNDIISKPRRGELSGVAFGGPDFDELYVTCGETVYKRKLQVKGAVSFRQPIKPPAPHL
jgi:sugar lactone lactonase YvrE/enterochelin esterase-like enzyme